MKTVVTDVLIVGSGFGGAVPAMRLAKAGLKTTVIERGKELNPYQSFKQTQDPKYLLQYYRNIAATRLSLQYIEALGGGSGFYEMISLRAPSLVFKLKDNKGQNIWPEDITRAKLDKYYERGEKMLNVQQIAEEKIPKTGHVFARLMKKCGYSVERARYAVKDCQNSGYCISGCAYGAKQSLLLNYLPEARKNGATIETEMDAFAISPIAYTRNSSSVPYRYWVLARDKKADDELVYYKTKILILSAGTIGTARLLLSSQKNLPELSSEVGKNISFNGSVKAIAMLPDWCPEGDMYSGRSHPGLVSYQFLEKEKIMVTAAKVLPVQLVSAARFNSADLGFPQWGKAYNELLNRSRHRMIILAALGIEPTRASLSVSENGKTNLFLNMNKDLKQHYYHQMEILNSIFRKTGCKPMPFRYVNRKGAEQPEPFFTSAHQLGSCRMGENASNSVVNKFGEVHNYPGMYVTDGAAIPSSTIVNPSLTILANSERIADHLVRKYQKNRIN